MYKDRILRIINIKKNCTTDNIWIKWRNRKTTQLRKYSAAQWTINHRLYTGWRRYRKIFKYNIYIYENKITWQSTNRCKKESEVRLVNLWQEFRNPIKKTAIEMCATKKKMNLNKQMVLTKKRFQKAK